MSDNDNTDKLAQWMKRLTEEELPALSTTTQEIARVAEDDQSPLSRLTDIILKDAAMTMHVLRLTDSAYHIPRKNRQNTISRAVVMLGINEIKSMCLSIAVFDPLIKKTAHRELTHEIARAFHAASQARYLAVTRGDTASEEIFIAALLLNLGDMIFWAFGSKDADTLRAELRRPDAQPAAAQKKVLGFELRELTGALSRKWGLGKLLESAVSDQPEDNDRLKTIAISHRFVRAAEKGWNSEEMKIILAELAQFSGLSPEALQPALRKNAEEAIHVAETFGAEKAGEELAKVLEAMDRGDSAEPEQGHKRIEAAPEPDAAVQLKALRDLADLVMRGASVGSVLEIILEGIYRGIGMDRAVFALLSPNRKYIRAKTAIGRNNEELAKRFKFEIDPGEPTIFDDVIREQEVRWIVDPEGSDIKHLFPQRITSVIGKQPFLVAPTVVDGQVIGIFFADRSASGREIDEAAFDAFRQFALQANVVLEYLGKY